MITVVLLAWCGFQLSAPTWYFVLLGIIALGKLFSFGWNMYKKGAEA